MAAAVCSGPVAGDEKSLVTKAQVVAQDGGLGLVIGFAIVCTEDGQPYFDVQGDHIPEDAMLKAAVEFMGASRMASAQHNGSNVGTILFAFPLTGDIARALDISSQRTGLLIAMKPSDPVVMQKFVDGTYTGFSIGGRRILDEDVA